RNAVQAQLLSAQFAIPPADSEVDVAARAPPARERCSDRARVLGEATVEHAPHLVEQRCSNNWLYWCPRHNQFRSLRRPNTDRSPAPARNPLGLLQRRCGGGAIEQRPPIDEQILRVDVEQTFPGDTEASGLQKLEVEGQSKAAKKL